MKYEDVPIDGEVIIGGNVPLSIFGTKAKVVNKVPPLDDGNEVYPFGVVTLKLPDNVVWPSREVYVGPENLAKVPE